MHDKHGNPLKAGDAVLIEATVKGETEFSSAIQLSSDCCGLDLAIVPIGLVRSNEIINVPMTADPDDIPGNWASTLPMNALSPSDRRFLLALVKLLMPAVGTLALVRGKQEMLDEAEALIDA